MTEQPQDHSDQELSLDTRIVQAMNAIDVLINHAIREEIGDDEYNQYLSRAELNEHLDEVVKDSDLRLKAPYELVNERATDIAKSMVVQGEEPSQEVKRDAEGQAFEEWVYSLGNDADDTYLSAYGDVTADVAEIVDLEMSMEYPGMMLRNSTDGLVTFSQEAEKNSNKPTLRISLQRVGEALETSIVYELPPMDTGRPYDYVEVDPAEFDNEIEGINLADFKAHALTALTAAIAGFSHERVDSDD